MYSEIGICMCISILLLYAYYFVLATSIMYTYRYSGLLGFPWYLALSVCLLDPIVPWVWCGIIILGTLSMLCRASRALWIRSLSVNYTITYKIGVVLPVRWNREDFDDPRHTIRNRIPYVCLYLICLFLCSILMLVIVIKNRDGEWNIRKAHVLLNQKG